MMDKVSITLQFEAEKLDVLEFFLKDENTSTQKELERALRELYERMVPEPMRRYLDRKSGQVPRSKRPAKPAAPKPQPKEPPVNTEEKE